MYTGKTEGEELGFRLLPPPPSPILTHPRQSTIGIEVARFEEGPGRGKRWAGSNARPHSPLMEPLCESGSTGGGGDRWKCGPTLEGSRVVLGGVGRLMLSWRMIHIFVSRAAATACTAPVQLDISSNREVHARRPVLLRVLNASDEPAGATHDSDVLAAAVPQARPRAFGSALGSSSAQVRHSRPSGPRPAARAMTSAAAMLIT